MNIRNSIGIIPARIGSTRLTKKVLRELNGKPILKWVVEGSSTSKLLRRLLVATDSEEIADFCSQNRIEFIMTPADLPSGSDRVYFAYKLLNEEADFIVNIQGDEPFISGDLIDTLIKELANCNADVSTLISKIQNAEEIFDPSVVKVVINKFNFALYFSRSPIPHLRDVQESQWAKFKYFWKHVGIYVYMTPVLKTFTHLKASSLEKIEKLEQLRLLENGYNILCVPTERVLIGIDTEADLLKAQNYLARFPSA